MDKWIRDLIASLASGLTTLVNAVADRIGWVYNVFIGFFIKVRNAFDAAVKFIQAKILALIRLVYEVYLTLRWIVVVRIPQVVNSAVSAATNYVIQQLIFVRDFLRGMIDGAIAFIRQQIERVNAWIDQIIRWADKKISDIVATLARVVAIVYNLLIDPRKLAAWVIDALIAESLRWVDRNADRLALILRNRSVEFTLYAAQRIENMITRLL